MYDVRLQSYGIKVAQFSDFGRFSPYKTPKKAPSGDQPTALGLHRRMIPIFSCDSRRSKGVPSGSGVFLRLLVGELWTPKLAQIFAYGKWLNRMLLHAVHGASDLGQRCLKMRNSKDGCTSHPNIRDTYSRFNATICFFSSSFSCSNVISTEREVLSNSF